MATCFITGGTGYLGSRLIVDLLKDDWQVVAFVRTNGQVTARQRLISTLKTLTAYDAIADRLDNLEVVEADLEQIVDYRHSGTSDDGYRLFVHSAALLKTSMDPDVVRHTNVGGTRNALMAAEGLRCDTFAYISTAYTCGQGPAQQNAVALIEEDAAPFQTFNNVYEESKWEAESLVRAQPIPHLILRPSILIHERSSYRADAESHAPVGLYGWFKLAQAADGLAKRQNQNRTMIPALTQAGMDFIDVDVTSEICGRIFKRLETGELQQPHLNTTALMVASRTYNAGELVHIAQTELGATSITCSGRRIIDPRHPAERLYQERGQFFVYYSTQYIRFRPSLRLPLLVGDAEICRSLGHLDLRDLARDHREQQAIESKPTAPEPAKSGDNVIPIARAMIKDAS